MPSQVDREATLLWQKLDHGIPTSPMKTVAMRKKNRMFRFAEPIPDT
jgi:hypothetical protein